MKKVPRLLCGVVLAVAAETTWAQVIFRDDFNDCALDQPLTQSGSAAPLTYTSYGVLFERDGYLDLDRPFGNGTLESGVILNHNFTDASIPLNTVGEGFAIETRVSFGGPDPFFSASLSQITPCRLKRSFNLAARLSVSD